MNWWNDDDKHGGMTGIRKDKERRMVEWGKEGKESKESSVERDKERDREGNGMRRGEYCKGVLLLRSQGGAQGGGDARGIPLFQRSYLYNLDCVVL